MKKRWFFIGLSVVLILLVSLFLLIHKKNSEQSASESNALAVPLITVKLLSLDKANKTLRLEIERIYKLESLETEIVGVKILLNGENDLGWEWIEEFTLAREDKKFLDIDYSQAGVFNLFQIIVFPVIENRKTGERFFGQEVTLKTPGDEEKLVQVIPKEILINPEKKIGGGGGGSGSSSGSGSSAVPQVSVCGNGILETGEQCDETITTDICDTQGLNPTTNGVCTLTFCGDGKVQSLNGENINEACDSLSSNCQTAGGYSGAASCAEDCLTYQECITAEFCGDGILNGFEECDDLNNINGDGCTDSCIIEGTPGWECGNSIVEPNEICDGNTQACTINGYSGTESCNANCDGFESCVTAEFCGDGLINGNERCDLNDLGEFGNGVNQCINYNPIYESGNLTCSGDCTFDTTSCANQNVLVPEGLIGFWNFDGDASDSSSNNNNGVIIGDTFFVAGKGGGALEFDGNGDYVDFGNVYNIENKFSLVAWVKWKGTGAGRAGTIIGKEMQSDKQYFLEISKNQKVRFYTFGLSPPLLLSNGICNQNAWCHVAATWDGTSKKIYINGQLNVQSGSTGTMIQNSDSFKVGYSKGTGNTNNYFNGTIDEVRIYDRALIGSEIQQLYTQFN